MRQLIGIMIVGLVFVAVIGCERDDPRDDAGSVYIKRPPNPADVPVDGRLMEDQRKLSRKYEDVNVGTPAHERRRRRSEGAPPGVAGGLEVCRC